MVDLEKINQLFDGKKNRKLSAVFDKYSVTNVERCSQVRAAPTINWIQILILIIAVFIGVVAFIASITICCLHSKWDLFTNLLQLYHITFLDTREESGEAISKLLRPQWELWYQLHCHQVQWWVQLHPSWVMLRILQYMAAMAGYMSGRRQPCQ